MSETSKDLGKEGKNARFLIYGEVLFALFPFIVAFVIVFSGYKDLSTLLYTSDWSLAASLLSGQAVIRFSSGMYKTKGVPNWQRATLYLTTIFIVSALSLVTYGTIQSHDTPSLFLAIFQIIIFIISLVIFLAFGSAGQYLLDKSLERDSKQLPEQPLTQVPEQMLAKWSEQAMKTTLEQEQNKKETKSNK